MNLILSFFGTIGGQTYIYIVLVLGGFSAGFYVEHLRFSDFKNGIQIVAERQIAENKAKEKEQELVNKGIENVYKADINNIHNFYNGMFNTSSGVVSSNANATITVNGETVDILSLAKQCAITTEQVITWQNWYKEQASLNDK